MKEEIRVPPGLPVSGYYEHYKHVHGMPIGEYVYYVVNVGIHTETSEYLAMYQPLYPSSVYLAGKFWDVRPMHAREKRTWWQWLFLFWQPRERCGFLDPKIINGKEVKRFTLIEDLVIIEKLEKIRKEMYGDVDAL